MSPDQAHPRRSPTTSPLKWSPGPLMAVRRTQPGGPRGRWRERQAYPRGLSRGSGWRMACGYEAVEATSPSSKWWARSYGFPAGAIDISHVLRDKYAPPANLRARVEGVSNSLKGARWNGKRVLNARPNK